MSVRFPSTSSKGWIHIKTVILRNALLSTFSKNIKQLTYAGCQSEIPLNSSQLLSTPLSIPYESEDLLPICYQISYGVPEKCVEVDFTRIGDFTWRESDCEELVGEVNYTTEYVTDLFSFVDFE